ncbi:winged helix-turn-helix transcriptional regulator [Alterisphingorhabdus coralli]|uniref:Helix-turn-helix domain-containing protein n=1 Tax=Alterisphingorhabdus coralli TaxID=3071408 RepID=A0AA97I0Q7_9SPHN|nr:helix-turn-helix domain-containing protein [Parasphingorhabdus sp. SCSIO 66989]WOE75242.1 helix-turn-helix domain-containing protein [Parasphingorhabdus sp. SCSIO 66989]
MGKLHEPLSELAGNCGLPAALEAMGERWSFMILRGSFNGLHHFEEFLEELGIARNILSNRLTKLVQAGILKRAPCADDRRKIEYRLTEKGMALLPVMIALRQWGERWSTGVPSNPVLCDERDRKPIAEVAIHAHDGRKLGPADLLWIDEQDLQEANTAVRADSLHTLAAR